MLSIDETLRVGRMSAAQGRTRAVDVHDDNHFGTLLRHHRLAAGLTQEELAERAHLSARGISDLERGARSTPRKETVQLLANALALSDEERTRFEAAVHATRAAGRERERRLPGLRRWRPRGRVVAATAAVLVLVIAVAVGLLVRGPAHTAGGSSTGPAPRDSFAPWGLTRSPPSSSPLRLTGPLRDAVDRQGNIYVTEGNQIYSFLTSGSRADVLKVSPSGQILARWGRFGKRPGEFDQPAGVAVDRQGNVYVADYGNDRIQKLSPSGRPLAVWGSFGTKPGQFDLPDGLALDPQGNVYVADYSNNRVQELSAAGKPLEVWGGQCGTAPGQFCNPWDVAIGPGGLVYVVDFSNKRIQRLDPAGQTHGTWTIFLSSPPNADSYFMPGAIAVDERGNVYMTNDYGNLLHKLSPTGKEVAVWQIGASTATSVLSGLAVDGSGDLAAVGDHLYRSSSDGRLVGALPLGTNSEMARFDRPAVVTADRQGNVYVVTGGSENALQKLSPAGRRLASWGPRIFGAGATYDLEGAAVDARGDVYLADVLNAQILKLSPDGRVVARWGSEGPGSGQLETPYGLAVDAQGNVYVTDTGNNRIQKLSPQGKPLAQWGTFGSHLGQLDGPRAVAVDAWGTIYVADTGNRRVVKLAANGKAVAAWTVTGSDADLTGVAVDRHGNVYAVDTVNDEVTEFSPAGEVVARWGTRGTRSGQFREPQSVAVDQKGNVYVADTGNDRVQRLSWQR
jgi:DNA-binding beta-propeller fold protein YncE/transcriptional regulator with XRE-family HTH domain